MCKELRGRKEFSRQEAPSTCSRGWINVYVRITLLAATSRDKNVVACLVISEYLAKGRAKWNLGVKPSRISVARIDHDTRCTDNRIVQIRVFIKMIKKCKLNGEPFHLLDDITRSYLWIFCAYFLVLRVFCTFFHLEIFRRCINIVKLN